MPGEIATIDTVQIDFKASAESVASAIDQQVEALHELSDASDEAAQATKEITEANEDSKSGFKGTAAEIGKLASKLKNMGLGFLAKEFKEIQESVARDTGLKEFGNDLAGVVDALESKGLNNAAVALKEAADPVKSNAKIAAETKAKAEADRAAKQAAKDRAKAERELAKALEQQEKEAEADALKAQQAELKKQANAYKTLGNVVKKAHLPFANFIRSIGRIALYRAIRTAIKAVTSAIKEGMSNLYAYSNEFKTAFAPAVDNLRQHVLLLKNSFATALRPALEALMPVIVQLCDWFSRLADFVAQVASVLFGKVDSNGRYTKAVLGDLEQSNKEAKELRRTLLGFDEINRLEGDTGSGTATSGGANFVQADVSDEAVAVAEKIRAIFEKAKEFFDGIDWESVKEVLAVVAGLFATGKLATGLSKIWSVGKKLLGLLAASNPYLLLILGVFGAFALWGDKISSWLDKWKLKLKLFYAVLRGITRGHDGLTSFINLMEDVGTTISDVVSHAASGIYNLVHGDIDGAKDDALWILATLIAGATNAVIDATNIILAVISALLNMAQHNFIEFYNGVIVWLANKIIETSLRAFLKMKKGALAFQLFGLVVLKELLDFFNEAVFQATLGINGLILFMNNNFGTKLEPIVINIDTTKLEETIDTLEHTELPELKENLSIIPKIDESKVPKFRLRIEGHLDAANIYKTMKESCNYMEERIHKIISPLNNIFTNSITAYASGGFPSAGSLILAGERGPELVANIGGSTGVMNTDQMASALYEAMSAALVAHPQGGGDIYLDGEVIYKNVVRRNNNHVRAVGRSAMLT